MEYLFLILLFSVAFLYASVGHGGASGYLALMALFNFAPATMKTSALLLNILVSLISFIQFYRAGSFRWNLFLPFVLTSIPASFAGALINIDSLVYKRILGSLLLLPVARLFFSDTNEKTETRKPIWGYALSIGAGIGLLSGMIGIGGGILLSPILLMLNWANLKETAATSALFIFVNSIAGLFGMMQTGLVIDAGIYLWVSIALAGGLAGAYVGSRKLNNRWLKGTLALVLLIASIKLLTVKE